MLSCGLHLSISKLSKNLEPPLRRHYKWFWQEQVTPKNIFNNSDVICTIAVDAMVPYQDFFFKTRALFLLGAESSGISSS